MTCSRYMDMGAKCQWDSQPQRGLRTLSSSMTVCMISTRRATFQPLPPSESRLSAGGEAAPHCNPASYKCKVWFCRLWGSRWPGAQLRWTPIPTGSSSKGSSHPQQRIQSLNAQSRPLRGQSQTQSLMRKARTLNPLSDF